MALLYNYTEVMYSHCHAVWSTWFSQEAIQLLSPLLEVIDIYIESH